MSKKRLILFDGNALIFRAYYGSAFSSSGILVNSKGTPVNAVLTLSNMINSLISRYQPSHVLVAFDTPKKTLRHGKLTSYKAGRRETPIELIKQLPLARTMFEKMGIKHYELDGFEADDIIGTLAKKYGDDNDIIVVSSDKDLYQLVAENVQVVSPQSGGRGDKVVSFSNFREMMGISPQQIIDYKGMVGDASDNLPGVKGIGDKSAVKLLNVFKTLEDVYENLHTMTDKTRQKFEQDRKIAFLCKELATLIYNIDVPYHLDELEYTNSISRELIDFYKDLELNSLVKRYENSVEDVEDSLFSNIVI